MLITLYFNSIKSNQFSQYTSERLRTMVLTVTLAKDEIVRTGMTLFPFLSVGFLIMSVFSIVSVRLSAFHYRQVCFLIV
jgi:hypothetical protein